MPADNPAVPECDWRVTSVEGSCREQLRRWRSLSTAYSLITHNPLCSSKDLSEGPLVSVKIRLSTSDSYADPPPERYLNGSTSVFYGAPLF